MPVQRRSTTPASRPRGQVDAPEHEQEKEKKAPSPPEAVVKGPSSPTSRVSASQRSTLPDVQLTLPTLSEPNFIDLLYKPHTILAALFGFVILFGVVMLWSAFLNSQIKAGMFAAIWSFVIFGMVYLPDFSLVRPHPAFWRAWLAIGVLYLMLMVFFVCLDTATSKWIIGLYDPVANDPLPEREYASDCRLWTEDDPFKFFWTVFDVFLLAHSLGFVVKMMLIRDWRICMVLSVLFEVVEVSMQHLMPNFKECWWDHLIVDVLVCNALGIYLGYLVVRYFKMKRYSWSKVSDIPTIAGKTKRIVQQFLPIEPILDYKWPIWDRFKNMLLGTLLVTVLLVQETNSFTMKSILNLSPTHHLVWLRLVMYGFIALPGLRQYHDFAYDPRCKKLGAMAWVGSLALFFETVWIGKMAYQGGYFRNAWSAHITIPWMYAATAFTTWTILFYSMRSRWERSRPFALALNALFWSVPVSLLCLFCMGNVDMRWGQRRFDQWAYQLGLWGPPLDL